jgi:hypothetical protein
MIGLIFYPAFLPNVNRPAEVITFRILNVLLFKEVIRPFFQTNTKTTGIEAGSNAKNKISVN